MYEWTNTQHDHVPCLVGGRTTIWLLIQFNLLFPGGAFFSDDISVVIAFKTDAISANLGLKNITLQNHRKHPRCTS